jgi:T4-like virus Myoviridae tail sheath stabiliser
MFRAPFYHATFRKVVSGFGKLFADIYVVRRWDSGMEKERIKVPLAYGPAEKYLGRTIEDPDLQRGYSVTLPRMSFQINSIQYDSMRKLNTLKKNVKPIEDEQGNVIRQYQGVPYKITMELSILCKYVDDANQIIEQILPWFTPGYTITINSIPEMDYKDDVGIVLSSVSLADNYEDDWKNRRSIIWTLSFEIKAMFYGPIAEKKVITKVQTDIHHVENSIFNLDEEQLSVIPRSSRVTIEPGDPKAEYNEDFGYTINTQFFEDGKTYNSATGQDEDATYKLSPDPIEFLGKVGRPKLS